MFLIPAFGLQSSVKKNFFERSTRSWSCEDWNEERSDEWNDEQLP